ncbi:hypothetical protein NDU88_007021 [Pleurodeles waltl]|uniref:Uncharacterized protein n=1 Tax=Pleurodeles waltl TaxID=8319 RepID=A0AAV7VSB0_PLEWA|nr:hypothetical protein NDU88_007021 [Pleurodeles waltl]
MLCCSVAVVFRPWHRGGSTPSGSSPPLSARGGSAAPQHPGSQGGRGPVRAPPSRRAPGPVRRRTLVRGSAEVRRPHPLLRPRSRLPSPGSRNSATPGAPSLDQLGGHAGSQKRRGRPSIYQLGLPGAWRSSLRRPFPLTAISFDGQITPVAAF